MVRHPHSRRQYTPRHHRVVQRKRPLRLMYVEGPGDVAATYTYWRRGEDDPSQVSLTYSAQFFDVCRDLGAAANVIALHPRRAAIFDGQYRILHSAPLFAQSRSGILYYLGQLWAATSVISHALRFRADVVFHGGGCSVWFVMRLLPAFNVAVVPVLGCVLWKKNEIVPSRAQRWIRRLDRAFWRRSVSATLSLSADISNQVISLAGADHPPIVEYLPNYRPGTFSRDPPPGRLTPFRVLFVGRIERNKGVFDLLEIARRLSAANRTEIEFDVCGTGSDLQNLSAEVENSGLSARLRLHGHCDRGVMREMFRNCHVVIAPTTTDFVEGFNKVVVEGILAGRPVITSSICPAIDYVRAAVVEVPPDEVSAYQRAIVDLSSNEALYESKRAACLALQGRFYDPSQAFGAAVRKVLRDLDRAGASEIGAPVSSARG